MHKREEKKNFLFFFHLYFLCNLEKEKRNKGEIKIAYHAYYSYQSPPVVLVLCSRR